MLHSLHSLDMCFSSSLLVVSMSHSTQNSGVTGFFSFLELDPWLCSICGICIYKHMLGTHTYTCVWGCVCGWFLFILSCSTVEYHIIIQHKLLHNHSEYHFTGGIILRDCGSINEGECMILESICLHLGSWTGESMFKCTAQCRAWIVSWNFYLINSIHHYIIPQSLLSW
jgi:hypothetical protein